MANLQEEGGDIVKDNTETSRSITLDASCAAHLNVNIKLQTNRDVLQKLAKQKNIIPKAKKSLSGQKQNSASSKVNILLQCESFQDIQLETSSTMQLMSVQNSHDQADTSRVFVSNNFKLADGHDVLLGSHSLLDNNLKRKKGRPKKSPFHLPTKEDDKEPPEKKPKSSSSFKNARNPSGELDVEFNALTLATEIGIEKPHETVTVKSSGNDKEEEITKQISPIEIIQQLIDYRKSCKCSCLADLSMRDIASHRVEVTLLDRHSRDFFIMGLLRCGAVTFKETCRHNNRIRNRFSYRLMNTRICHCCFLAVNNIGGKYLKNLKKHFAEHGVTSRLHGNLGRKPYHAISSDDITDVVEFVNRYASSHGIPAARRPKNPKTKRIIRLPPLDNVTSVHKKYKEFYEKSGKRAVALTSFRKIWNRHLPHIKLTVKDPASPVKNLPASISTQEPMPNIDSDIHKSALKQMLQTKRGSQAMDSMTQSPDLQTGSSQKIPVSLPYEYGSCEMPHNQMMSLNMYVNDGDNHDALQYGYIFTQSSVPMTYHHQTVASSSLSPSVLTSSKTSISETLPSSVQHPSFSVTVNSPVKHVAMTDTYNPSTDKHLLMLSPSSALDAYYSPDSSQSHVSQFGQK